MGKTLLQLFEGLDERIGTTDAAETEGKAEFGDVDFALHTIAHQMAEDGEGGKRNGLKIDRAVGLDKTIGQKEISLSTTRPKHGDAFGGGDEIEHAHVEEDLGVGFALRARRIYVPDAPTLRQFNKNIAKGVIEFYLLGIVVVREFELNVFQTMFDGADLVSVVLLTEAGKMPLPSLPSLSP